MTPEETFAKMVAEGDSVLGRLDHCARTLPDKVFIHYGEDGVELTFAEFKQRTDRIAAGLAAMGVTEGVPVSVLTRNSLLSALAMFAIWRSGGIFAPVNFNFRGQLLSYQLRDTEPFALVTDPSFAEVLGEIIDEVPLRRLITHTPAPHDHDFTGLAFGSAFKALDIVSFAELGADDAPVPSIDRGPFDLANIVYTSGTTGPSKGVVQPFRWMNHYGFPLRQLTSSDDVIYCDLPLYHVGGAFALLARAVWQGNTVGLWDKFSPNRFWDRIAECGATTCVLLDVMVPYLMSGEPRASDRANTLNKVHMQPFPANHHEVARRFGIDFMTVGFGQTESGSAFAALIDQFMDGDGTPRELWRGSCKRDLRALSAGIGRPVLDGSKPLPKGLMGAPNPLFEVAILDEDDNLLPPGQVGQLAFRPRFPGLLLQEYFRKPEATLKAFRTCWFHTGDACRQLDDGSGMYAFVDRMGGFFRVRGENVSSFEVEALIAGHDKVRAVAAVPIPAKIGEEEDVAVFVELVEGEALTEDELRDHTRRVMPKYMQPTYIRFVPALPVTPTNKVEKYKLKRQIFDELNLSARQPRLMQRKASMTARLNESDYLEQMRALWHKAWPKDAPRVPQYPHGEVALSEYLRAWARRQPERSAVIFYGHVLSYAELDRQSDRFAALLAAMGVRKGDRVAVFLPNCPQFHIVFFGILKLGAVHVPVSPLSRAFELEYELNDTDAEVIVALDQLVQVVDQVKAKTKLREVIVTSFADVLPANPAIPVPDSIRTPRMTVSGATDLLPAMAALGEVTPLPAAALDDVAALNYTGGTTGMPKGCVHTQRDMVYTAAANYGIALDINEDSICLSFFPEFWIAGENLGLIFPLFAGATLVLLARWDAIGVLSAIQTHKVTLTAMPVDGAVELMDHPRFGEFDLSSLRQIRVVSFVKKLNTDYRRRWKELTGTILAESAWGMTETHTSNTFTTGFQDNDFDLNSQPIFVGLPVPGAEFKITDFETGELVPVGSEGEIRVRTPSLLKSYWNKPQATAEALVDGWLRTGDIGLIDTDGFIHFLGRRKEMLKVKGMSVFPPEIEALLGQHPAVLGSGVVGREDAERGQVPVAYIQLKPEAKGTVTPHELQAWCKERMAVYKVPEVRIIEALPMTATGKVKKQELVG